ncbi:MAG TPA: hypothetical protein VL284_05025 [Thermoanaerobaculia bacterium]|nr:hypothetical protein [Thermoanaerobaculia bacterium]
MTANLQHRFVHALAKRCGDILEVMERPDDLQALTRGFRGLASVALMFGYPAVSEVSRRCEMLCTAALDQKRPLTPFDRARLIAGVVSIRHFGTPFAVDSGVVN